eukprot:scaffold96999_cov37-Tisochrysis_lutea.AAC.1
MSDDPTATPMSPLQAEAWAPLSCARMDSGIHTNTSNGQARDGSFCISERTPRLSAWDPTCEMLEHEPTSRPEVFSKSTRRRKRWFRVESSGAILANAYQVQFQREHRRLLDRRRRGVKGSNAGPFANPGHNAPGSYKRVRLNGAFTQLATAGGAKVRAVVGAEALLQVRRILLKRLPIAAARGGIRSWLNGTRGESIRAIWRLIEDTPHYYCQIKNVDTTIARELPVAGT